MDLITADMTVTFTLPSKSRVVIVSCCFSDSLGILLTDDRLTVCPS